MGLIIFNFSRRVRNQYPNLFLVLFFEQIHLESCPFQQVACANKNCSEKVQRRHLTQHENNMCPWRILQCIYCTEPHPRCMMQVRIVTVKESMGNNTPLGRKYFNISVNNIETISIEWELKYIDNKIYFRSLKKSQWGYVSVGKIESLKNQIKIRGYGYWIFRGGHGFCGYWLKFWPLYG